MIKPKLGKITSFCAHLCCDLGADLFLGLGQTFLGQFCPPVTVSDEGLQVIHRLKQRGDLLQGTQSLGTFVFC